jgi:hypothetical protein
MTVKTANVPALQHFLYVLIGSVPMIITTMIMSYILYSDYARNNYSFWRQDLYLSNVEKHQYQTELVCDAASYASDSSNNAGCLPTPSNCFRHYTDFALSDAESESLRK